MTDSPVQTPPTSRGATGSGRMVQFVLMGAALGALVGYLTRPSAFLVGQVPFMAVITRGASLRGLDQLLLPLARESFDRMLAFLVVGGIIGFAASRWMAKK